VGDLFNMLMVVNPSIEVYLLDADGVILAHQAPPGRLQRDRVDPQPIRAFLAGEPLPLAGDNPRGPTRRETFSATPLRKDRETAGYLYIILAGDDYRLLAEDVWQGHVFKIAMWTGAGALILTLLLGLFALITRRLNALARTIAAFENASFSGTVALDPAVNNSPDEIGQLARTFTKMAERIAAQVAQIKSQDELRREMVANVSHDLRTPLTSMRGYLETLLRKSEHLTSEERQRYLRVAVRQSQSVALLAQELFELAKLECEEVRPNWERFSLWELAQDVVRKFELAAQGKGVRTVLDIADDIPPVYADIGMIERVLTNLIDNALRHTPEGGEIRMELRRGLKARVEVRVIDTGSGIAEEYLPELFERHAPFRENRRKTHGAGLGLLIVRRILQLHGSPIEAMNGPERGAVFAFSLSAAGAEPLPVPAACL
jgi:signal transduction histidine kinase